MSRTPDFKTMSIEEQWKYVHSADVGPRRAMARSPYAHEAVLALLAKDPDFDTRCAVALNSETPEVCLMRLAQDKNPEVNLCVAKNRYAPPYALIVLACVPDALVRHAVLEHPNTPEDTRADLTQALYS